MQSFSAFVVSAAQASGVNPASVGFGVEPQTIVSIVASFTPSQSRSPSSTSSAAAAPTDLATASMSTGAIIGIAVGGGVFVLFFVAVALWCFSKRKDVVKPARKDWRDPQTSKKLSGSSKITVVSHAIVPGQPGWAPSDETEDVVYAIS